MSDIGQEIMAGDHDDQLNTITDAVRGRLKYLETVTHRTIQIGDTVRFNDQASPKYMVGLRATVVGKSRTKVDVELHETVGRFDSGVPINTPMAIIEIVED